jgi:hypothetical protein
VLPQWPKKVTIVVGSDSLWLYHQGQSRQLALQTSSSRQSIDFNVLNEQLEPYMTSLSGKAINIVLANAWVRYTILPWQPYLYAKRDWQAVAERYLRSVYGKAASMWNISVSMQGYGQPLIVCAVDSIISEGFDDLARRNGLQLNSLEPAFANVVNHYQHCFRSDSWLLMAEENRLVLAQSYQGIWQHFSVSVPPPGQANQQSLTLVRQARQLSSEADQVKLYLCGHSSLIASDFGDDIDVQMLLGATEPSSPAQLCYGWK